MQRTVFLIIFLLAASVSAFSQGFPWNDFKERKVSGTLAATIKAIRPDDTMFLATDVSATRAKVIFTGKSRPVGRERKAFLHWWAGLLNHPESYADLYETEYLYKEGSDEFWLPTQAPITKYFDKELRPGDEMVLFLISAGAYRDKKGVEGVLLVEEYQLPKNLNRTIKTS